MDFEQIEYSVEERIATITLNRPDRLNAWTQIMMDELIRAMNLADSDDDVRVVIVTGAGRAFCAGADLSGDGLRIAGKEGKAPPKRRDTAGQVTLRIFDMKKPVIAAINGHAVGVGITMTLAMDIRFVAEEATKIGFIFNKRGLVPEGCSTYFLPKIVGVTRATELILTGRMFTAKEGMEMGLFSEVVPVSDLMPMARKTAGEIAENTSAISTALSRQMLWKGLGEDHPMAAHIIESNCLDFMIPSRDCVEGAASFLEKRSPQFQMKPGVDMPDFYPWWKERQYKAGS